MKHTLRFGVSLAALVLLALPVTGEPSKYTANYVRGNSLTELGKKVSVDVSWVQAVRRAESDDFAVYAVHTWDERENLPGGIIAVVIPKSEAASFVNKYEKSPDLEKRRGPGGADLNTRRLSGVVRESSRKGLYIDLTDGAAAKAGVNFSIDTAGGLPLRERIREKNRGKG